MTAQDQLSRAVIATWNAQADEHNQWETLGDDEKIEWAMQAARALPADGLEPMARLREITKGIDEQETQDDGGWWETSTGAEFGCKKLAELEALVRSLIALPAGVKPVAEIYAGSLLWVSQGPDADPVTGDHDLYTAAQVLAMGRAPECPVPCGWDALHKLAVGDGAYLTRIDWPEDEEGVSVQRAVVMRTVTNLIDACRAMLPAAPKERTP